MIRCEGSRRVEAGVTAGVLAREDIVGHSFWSLDPAFNVKHADQVWDEIKNLPWRTATFQAWTNTVPWYRSHKSLDDEWNAKHPGKPITYDPGGLIRNLLIKYPGRRAQRVRSARAWTRWD